MEFVDCIYNAFFLAGCLVIVAGTASRLGAGQEWNNFQLLNAESFREMNSSERANFIINASSSISLVILGLLTGILLILISVIVAYILQSGHLQSSYQEPSIQLSGGASLPE